MTINVTVSSIYSMTIKLQHSEYNIASAHEEYNIAINK